MNKRSERKGTYNLGICNRNARRHTTYCATCFMAMLVVKFFVLNVNITKGNDLELVYKTTR